jgi:predicted tellurium resistance membrane protein TerC
MPASSWNSRRVSIIFFAISIIFTYFAVPIKYQHRVVFWGILGVIVMRGVTFGSIAGGILYSLRRTRGR